MDFFFFQYVLEELEERLWKEGEWWRHKERKETEQYHQPIQFAQEQLQQ